MSKTASALLDRGMKLAAEIDAATHGYADAYALLDRMDAELALAPIAQPVVPSVALRQAALAGLAGGIGGMRGATSLGGAIPIENGRRAFAEYQQRQWEQMRAMTNQPPYGHVSLSSAVDIADVSSRAVCYGSTSAWEVTVSS